MDFEKLKTCLLDVVAVDGRPFSFVDSSGMQGIVRPLVAAMPDMGSRKTIRSEDIMVEAVQRATAERDEIRRECRGRLLSLKLDGVSRLGRSFLGINIQMISGEKMCLRMLSVCELDCAHTAQKLKEKVLKVLDDYGISITQLYSVTVDNGANMVKLVKLIQEEYAARKRLVTREEEPSENDGQEEPSSPLSDNNQDVNFEEEEEEEDDVEKGFADVLEQCALSLLDGGGSSDELSISLVRCAAHCLNLAVKDSLGDPATTALLSTFRKLCKKLRTPQVVRLLRLEGLSVPPLDCETRWGSTADMLESLIKLRDFCQNNIMSLKHFISQEEFDRLEELMKCLRPARRLCTLLQGEQVTMGDFFGYWLRCKFETKQVGTPFADVVTKNLEKREEDLLKNPALVSALYLDPRYFTLLTPAATRLAELCLEKTWERMEGFKRTTEEESIASGDAAVEPPAAAASGAGTATIDVDADDPLEQMLRKADESRMAVMSSQPRRSILPLLRQFQKLPRVPRTCNLLSYWESQKHTMPELYALAAVVHAAPCTQVSVERLFSGVKFVLSSQRFNLSADKVDDLMVIRTNSLFRGVRRPKKRAQRSTEDAEV